MRGIWEFMAVWQSNLENSQNHGFGVVKPLAERLYKESTRNLKELFRESVR